MTERSYPVVNKNLTETEWQTIQIVNGNGVIDQGGWPYLLTDIDSATNTVAIAVDQKTGKNKAYLSGFIHEITDKKTLSVPGVITETIYEIGLVYDPANNTTEAGPISLEVYTLPADYSAGKTRLPLYRITRRPNVSLTSSTILEIRQRVSHIEVVNTETELPRAEDTLIETVAVTRDKGEFYRLSKIEADNSLKWEKIGSGDATYSATPGTIAKRSDSGAVQVKTGTHPDEAVNNQTLTNAFGGAGWTPATPYPEPHSIARRFDSGVMRVGTSVVDQYDALNRAAGDGRYAYKSHTHPGSDITSRVPYEHVDGSTHAYNTAWGGVGSVRTVHVTSGGEFCFYSSTEDHKINIELWSIDPREALAVEPIEFDRLDPTTGEPTGYHDYGVKAEQAAEHLPMFVERDENGKITGWSYLQWTTAHQVLHRWHAERHDELEAQIAELKKKDAEKDQLIAELTRRLDALDGGSQVSEA